MELDEFLCESLGPEKRRAENSFILLIIDDIIDPEVKSTRVKVLTLYMWRSGKTDLRAPEAKEDILLLENIASKNCQRVANAVVKHKKLKPETLEALWHVFKVNSDSTVPTNRY